MGQQNTRFNCSKHKNTVTQTIIRLYCIIMTRNVK